MASWNWPALMNKIVSDIPFLQKALTALLKMNPSSISDVPQGAKRVVESSTGKWQIQQYLNNVWTKLKKLDMDVETVDGFHASVTPNKNAIAVRDANGALQGNITGNAATATSAASLSTTLPVNKGGTSATTTANARANLGVPPISHASAATTYGVATDSNFGHVRSDGSTTQISAGEVVVKDVAIGGNITDLLSDRGYFTVPSSAIDWNIFTKTGIYRCYSSGTSNSPVQSNATTGMTGTGIVCAGASNLVTQLFMGDNTASMQLWFRCRTVSGVFQPWMMLLSDRNIGDGIKKSGSGSSIKFSVPEYDGPTTTTTGIAGLVPPAPVNTYNKFLRSDGEWATPPTGGGGGTTTYTPFAGATASAAGKAGLVPAPAAGKQTSFLCGDGTWRSPFSITSMWKNLGTRSSTGVWTINGVTVGVPMFIFIVRNNKTANIIISFTNVLNDNSGFINNAALHEFTPAGAIVFTGGTTYRYSSNVIGIVPQATRIKVNINALSAANLYAYQFK